MQCAMSKTFCCCVFLSFSLGRLSVDLHLFHDFTALVSPGLLPVVVCGALCSACCKRVFALHCCGDAVAQALQELRKGE